MEEGSKIIALKEDIIMEKQEKTKGKTPEQIFDEIEELADEIEDAYDNIYDEDDDNDD